MSKTDIDIPITFKIKMTFNDLRRNGISIQGTDEYTDDTIGDMHAGSTFDGTITMRADASYDFVDMLTSGMQVVFWVASSE